MFLFCFEIGARIQSQYYFCLYTYFLGSKLSSVLLVVLDFDMTIRINKLNKK